MQLIMTAKQGSIDDLPPKMRDNVLNTLKLNPELKVRFLNDTDCSDFIASNFDSDLHSTYVNEKYGPYRGDICRAAVMSLEGGFYTDLDVQVRVPFSEMVDSTTTFMTALSSNCDVLNALFAAERGSRVMTHVVEEIRAWYRGHTAPAPRWMGTVTMMRGLQQALRDECPEVDIKKQSLQKVGVQCGPDHNIRLFREQEFKCQAHAMPHYWEQHPECTPTRATGGTTGKFWGLMFGIFEPCTPAALRKKQCDQRSVRGPLVAWSRFEACTGWGCEQQRRREADLLAAQGLCQ
jgi:hypothetical protein